MPRESQTTVVIKAINKTPTPLSFHMLWEETTTSTASLRSMTQWSGTFTVGRLQPPNKEALELNRLGLCVSAFDYHHENKALRKTGRIGCMLGPAADGAHTDELCCQKRAAALGARPCRSNSPRGPRLWWCRCRLVRPRDGPASLTRFGWPRPTNGSMTMQSVGSMRCPCPWAGPPTWCWSRAKWSTPLSAGIGRRWPRGNRLGGRSKKGRVRRSTRPCRISFLWPPMWAKNWG